MTPTEVEASSARRRRDATLATTWHAVAARPITDELLRWPPNVFALTDTVLERTEGFRFALALPGEWPPARFTNWAHAVTRAGHEWSRWVEAPDDAVPELVAAEWRTLRDGADVALEQIARGDDRRLCEALLTLHAMADEACAGLAVALDTFDADACVYRVRGRELLARTGSLASVSTTSLRVLPKVRTPPTGRASFGRYACVQGPGIEPRWHKVPIRHRGTSLTSEHASLLLLPWPMKVRESDFRPIEESVRRLGTEPFGFFEFAPAERLDLDLFDRVLVAARDEVRSVDVVIMPESAIDEDEVDDVEALLDRHAVAFLQAGIRQRRPDVAQLPSNSIHIGFNPRLEKGGPPPTAPGGQWFHLRQNKHHRWSLDERQIDQYHLGGALHPHIRWWEAMDVPRRVVHFVEVAELTLVSLVCEDLAQNDDIAELMRTVGPTIVACHLLDGPQLGSRWAARYATGLADDPGSAVLTLTSAGMARRSRPLGREASPIVALWRDPTRGTREIPLEPGSHGVLLTVCMDRTTRRSADGRWPVENGTHVFDVGVSQLRASSFGSGVPAAPTRLTGPHPLDIDELTVLTAWAEAVAEVLAFAPERLAALLAEAPAGAAWRATLGLPEPSPRLGAAIAILDHEVRAAVAADGALTLDAVLHAAGEERPREPALDGLVRRVLRAMLEQRHTRLVPAPAVDAG